MADTHLKMTTSPENEDLKKPIAGPSSTPSATTPETISHKAKPSWREKLHIGSKTEEPGKESWRNASLSEEQRWKQWQKAKDKEQKEGGATGVFTHPYKAKGKGKWAYWLAL